MNDGVRILIVGNADSAVGWAPPSLHPCEVSSVDAAVDWLAETHADLVVLVAHRRGDFCANDVQRLSVLAPLSRVVVVASPWCEGPWRRDVDRLGSASIIPWHRWTAWLRTNAGQLRGSLPAIWSLPATAGVDELAEYWSGCRLPQGRSLVAVHSPDRDAAEAIGDMLALAGYASCWQMPDIDSVVQGVAVHVVEADGWNEALGVKIRSLREQSADLPLMLLVNFPLPDDIQAARAAGANAVLGKPFTLCEFLGQLGALLPDQVSHEEAA